MSKKTNPEKKARIKERKDAIKLKNSNADAAVQANGYRSYFGFDERYQNEVDIDAPGYEDRLRRMGKLPTRAALAILPLLAAACSLSSEDKR